MFFYCKPLSNVPTDTSAICRNSGNMEKLPVCAHIEKHLKPSPTETIAIQSIKEAVRNDLK